MRGEKEEPLDHKDNRDNLAVRVLQAYLENKEKQERLERVERMELLVLGENVVPKESVEHKALLVPQEILVSLVFLALMAKLVIEVSPDLQVLLELLVFLDYQDNKVKWDLLELKAQRGMLDLLESVALTAKMENLEEMECRDPQGHLVLQEKRVKMVLMD